MRDKALREDNRLLPPEEIKLRGLLWAAHRCSGKYSDDGELQCGRFLPLIDFLRDTPEDIESKIPIHYAQLAKVDKARQPGRGKVRELTEILCCAVAAWHDEHISYGVFELIDNDITDQILSLVNPEAIRREERERIKPYCEDTIEILANAQGEWADVTKTYAPEWTHPLKEVVEFMEQALRGKGE